MFFELAPPGSENPSDVIPAWEAVVGQSYDLLVTNHGGLCRCRVGETVQVRAMFGKMPIVSVEPVAKGRASFVSVARFCEITVEATGISFNRSGFFPPNSKVWGSLLEKGSAPGRMGGTRIGAGGPGLAAGSVARGSYWMGGTRMRDHRWASGIGWGP